MTSQKESYQLTATEQEFYRTALDMLFGSPSQNTMRRGDYLYLYQLLNKRYRSYIEDNIQEYTIEYYSNVYLPAKTLIREAYPDIVAQTAAPQAPDGVAKTNMTEQEARDLILANKQATGGTMTPEEQATVVEAIDKSDIGQLVKWIKDLISELATTVKLLKSLMETLPEYLKLVNSVLQLFNENKDAIKAGADIVKEYSTAMQNGKQTLEDLRNYLKENHMTSGDPYIPWPEPNFSDDAWTEMYGRVQLAKGLPIVGNQIQAMLSTMQAINYQAQTGIGYINTIDALAGAPSISSGFVPGLGTALLGEAAGMVMIPRWFYSTERQFAQELHAVEIQLHAQHNSLVRATPKS